MKKLLTVILAAALIFSLTCAGAVELTAPGEFPIVTEPVTLTIGLVPNALTVSYEDNELTEYIEERTGVHLEFYYLPTGSEASQKLSLMVAANEKLPDIIWLGLDDITRAQYGQSGTFIPLNDYFSNPDFNHYWQIAMDTYATPEQTKTVVTDAYSFDGNMYAYPQFAFATFDTCATGFLINQKWLDNLGLSMPTTTEEFYQVLKAFKEQDANGNGDPNDEIPLLGCTGGYYTDIRMALMNAFVYDAFLLKSSAQMEVIDGKLSAPFITEAFQQGLIYINRLVTEGLLSPLSFSQSQSELVSIMSAPNDQDTVVGCVCGTSTLLFTPVDKVERAYEYAVLPPLTGPDNVCWAPYTGMPGNYNTFITKDCQYPDVAYRLLDSLGEIDMTMTMRYGKKDVDWKYTSEGRIAHWRLSGYKTIYTTTPTAERPMPWSNQNSVLWHNNFANMLPPALIDGGVRVYNNALQEYVTDILGFAATPLKIDKHPSDIAFSIAYTADELDEISEIRSSVMSYVDESYTRFILGDLDPAKDWDSYLKDLENMGLDYYMEISQQAYDRAVANAGK